MSFPIKKIIFIFTFNFSLFLILMIGLQNSSNKKEVNLIINKTINLPIGFIVGVSFLSGSISGNLLSVNFRGK
tara:strand:- start:869 stop:1087 length:219 start_codon:yes stop_codon:yes gene_type:complete